MNHPGENRVPTGSSRRILAFSAAFFILATLCSCDEGERQRADFVIGTVCTVKLVSGGDAGALDAVFSRLREIESEMSANKEGTFVDAINDAAGIKAVPAPADLRFVLAKALRYAEESGGAFDPTVGPLVRLWGIGTEGERVPADGEIAALLPLVGYRDVAVDDAAGTVFLARKGMRIDLGAIAKGYAADEAARILTERRVRSAIIDLGGNIKVLGRKSDGKDWRIGIQDPFNERGTTIATANVKGGTVVTSGVYERFFVADGVHYHHILDTATGKPVRNGLVSVTVVADVSIDADGLSTTLFALGYDRGSALAESMPGVCAMFVDEGKKVRLTPRARGVIVLTDPSFVLVD